MAFTLKKIVSKMKRGDSKGRPPRKAGKEKSKVKTLPYREKSKPGRDPHKEQRKLRFGQVGSPNSGEY